MIATANPNTTYTYEATPLELPEQKDPELTYAGEVCNCYAFVKNRIENLPKMDAIVPNSEPVVGSVSVEYFKGIKHVAIVTEVTDDGVWVVETNYHHCQSGQRFIPFNKYSLVGFWFLG